MDLNKLALGQIEEMLKLGGADTLPEVPSGADEVADSLLLDSGEPIELPSIEIKYELPAPQELLGRKRVARIYASAKAASAGGLTCGELTKKLGDALLAEYQKDGRQPSVAPPVWWTAVHATVEAALAAVADGDEPEA